MTWLAQFAEAAGQTDRFIGRPDHVALLAAGLLGETGSVLTELKKEQRERDAYPAYRRRMVEELGDFLWYFVRLATVVDEPFLRDPPPEQGAAQPQNGQRSLPLFLELGAAVGDLLATINRTSASQQGHEMRPLIGRIWALLGSVSAEVHVPLKMAAENNLRKIRSRWPDKRTYAPLFDEEFAEEERLPRHLEVEFREQNRGESKVVVLRCNGINFGDRITDNIQDADGYRYHDVFHLAYAVHLGWSPVVRSLLRCKRKSSARIDDGEDGARAAILEEAVAATVFSRAKELNFFDGLDHLDYDLLKTVREFVHGYEVESIPLWQWEAAILNGYATFRRLRSNRGGRVVLDLQARQLTYVAPL